MQYLGLALFAEGSKDHLLLPPVLRRAVEELCFDSLAPVQLSDRVLALSSPKHLRDRSREERILEAARQAVGAWQLLFVHTDAGGDAGAARAERVEPALKRIRQELTSDGRAVGVVPVRETEAWALADGDALRRAFGANLSDEEMGLPKKPRDVERIQDPKQALGSAYRSVGPRGKAARQGADRFLGPIGEGISLGRLRGVPAFERFEAELRRALVELRVLPEL